VRRKSSEEQRQSEIDRLQRKIVIKPLQLCSAVLGPTDPFSKRCSFRKKNILFPHTANVFDAYFHADSESAAQSRSFLLLPCRFHARMPSGRLRRRFSGISRRRDRFSSSLDPNPEELDEIFRLCVDRAPSEWFGSPPFNRRYLDNYGELETLDCRNRKLSTRRVDWRSFCGFGPRGERPPEGEGVGPAPQAWGVQGVSPCVFMKRCMKTKRRKFS